MGDPERLTSTVAPARAASDDGGTGTHMSSQTSTWKVRPGTSATSKSRFGPKGTTAGAAPAPSRTPFRAIRREPAALAPSAKCRFS